MIINAVGTDRICLWEFHGGKIKKTFYQNISEIFVSGDQYDLEFLARQFDDSGWIRYLWDEFRDIYGNMKGLVIQVQPSKEREIIRIIQFCGYGRKFSIFNASIDPVLRFMAKRKLRFFEKASIYDMEPQMPVTNISVKESRMGDFSEVTINGSTERNMSIAMDNVYSAIDESVFVIYSNHMGSFTRFLRVMENKGYRIPHIYSGKGESYESYGQVHYSEGRIRIRGKICINSSSMFYSESGLEGILHISGISGLNPETVAFVTPGTAVSSMEIYMALSLDILVPAFKDDHEREKSIEELFNTDKGGFVLQPDSGIYHDIYEIDFSSMYPTIIVNYNLSPETIHSSHGKDRVKLPGDNPYYVQSNERGFLSRAIETLLKERLMYKTIKSMNEVYNKRDIAMKWLLVTSFGYTGYKNARFGRIELHEAITSIGRWALSRAMRIAEEEGFSIIHGIVDSLWIKGNGNVARTIRRIREETRINIVMDSYYYWLFIPPARSGLGSLNRYFGLRRNSGMKIRGIDSRRSDVPEISRKMQQEILNALSKCRNAQEILSVSNEINGIKNRYMANIRKLKKEEFILNIKPTRRLEHYKVENIQKAAIRSARSQGIRENPGQRMAVIVKDGKRKIIAESSEDVPDYRFYEKYIERAYEPFQHLISSIKTKGPTTLENWL
ncbi:MAG: type B DNA-directed DNA polymerase [Thermoplasmataceae archaeon]